MPITKTTLFNLALARVGSLPLDDADTDAANGVKSAIACNNAHDQTIKEVARAGRWNCLKDRAILDRIDDAPEYGPDPEFGWRYNFWLPANCVRLLQLNGTCIYNDGPSELFEIEGRKLLTNEAIARVQYIKADTCYDDWDPLFLDCIVVLLASKIAFELRQDADMASTLRNEYERVTLPRGRQKNGDERRRHLNDPSLLSSFVASRRFSTRG